MSSVEVHRRVRAPVETVWEVATDLEAAPEVVNGIVEVDVLTPGPFGVGTRWRETRLMFGRRATEELRIAAVDPGRSYTAEAASGGAAYSSTFTFTPVDDSTTELSMSFGARPTTAVARLLGVLTGPLARRSVVAALQADLADVATEAERRVG